MLLFPQGFITAPDLLTDEPSMLLDIGGWTVDLMRIDNGRSIIGICHRLEFGMIRCIDKVRERVRQNAGLSLTDAQIEQVLAGRPCNLEETVRSLIREQGRLCTERLPSAVPEAGLSQCFSREPPASCRWGFSAKSIHHGKKLAARRLFPHLSSPLSGNF